ncbi:uncharacterized protein [Aegilops tauschii subsp. strangulata]|uniref:uncharacterized protein n=1 Tax=Aegilops tauschii subsp. strangulata TaxID=200361 RepID=UPI001ABCDEDD|nr:uncharacterized protein LOC109773759 [Aegilops tauschii subsp. strangulata]
MRTSLPVRAGLLSVLMTRVLMSSCTIFNWNVRGLNDRARIATVRSLIDQTRCSLVCLWETKREVFPSLEVSETVGPRLAGHAILPATGTRGGILLAWDTDLFHVSNTDLSPFAITITLNPRTGDAPWSITTVYGPCEEDARLLFLADLARICAVTPGPWVIVGDFNLIYEARDKNNSNLNIRMMRRFRDALNNSELKEIKLSRRRFTWSNEQADPTLVRLDRAFCDTAWDLRFSNARLQPLATAMSDHCPLLLTCERTPRRSPRFRFEAFWTHIEGFREVITSAWNQPCPPLNALGRLDYKLKREARALKLWQKNCIGDIRLQFLMAQDTLLLLDAAQESRLLDRCRKNFIAQLSTPTAIATDQAHKEQVAKEYFTSIIGTPAAAVADFEWAGLDLPRLNLTELEAPFSADEIIINAIKDLPGDRAPRPDGFYESFFKATVDIIISDLLLVFQQLYQLNPRGLDRMNGAHVVLIPKVDGANALSDYRPISLLHSVAKLFLKVLAMRLAKRLPELVLPGQSAFTKGCSIQDNFLFVQGLARHFRRTKRPMLFLKLDIAKAFDMLAWPYLLNMLRARGFGEWWCEWIAMILSSASSRVIINGCAGDPIHHAKGVRQGDPISPSLFILAMEPLQRLIEKAVESNLLSQLRGRIPPVRVSLYADDVALFINPVKDELVVLKSILSAFGDVTGLRVNFAKSSVIPIRCDGLDMQDIVAPFGARVAAMPTRFLGLPLSLRKLRKIDYQPLLDKIRARLSGLVRKSISCVEHGYGVAMRVVMAVTDCLYSTMGGTPNAMLHDRPLAVCHGNSLQLGNGRKACFWLDAWLEGQAPCLIAPDIFNITACKHRTVASTLTDGHWIRDLQGRITADTLPSFVALWTKVAAAAPLVATEIDSFEWRFSTNGCYSAHSAYMLQFTGSVAYGAMSMIWRTWAPAKHKFFAWLLAQKGS